MKQFRNICSGPRRNAYAFVLNILFYDDLLALLVSRAKCSLSSSVLSRMNKIRKKHYSGHDPKDR